LPPTLIARWGNDGHEYTSGMFLVGYDPAITEAHSLAKDRGLIKGEAS
jgi:hypothetical protein